MLEVIIYNGVWVAFFAVAWYCIGYAIGWWPKLAIPALVGAIGLIIVTALLIAIILIEDPSAVGEMQPWYYNIGGFAGGIVGGFMLHVGRHDALQYKKKKED